MTPAVRQHVHNLARAVLVRKAPILLQASLWHSSWLCSCSPEAGWLPFTVLHALTVPLKHCTRSDGCGLKKTNAGVQSCAGSAVMDLLPNRTTSPANCESGTLPPCCACKATCWFCNIPQPLTCCLSLCSACRAQPPAGRRHWWLTWQPRRDTPLCASTTMSRQTCRCSLTCWLPVCLTRCARCRLVVGLATWQKQDPSPEKVWLPHAMAGIGHMDALKLCPADLKVWHATAGLAVWNMCVSGCRSTWAAM